MVKKKPAKQCATGTRAQPNYTPKDDDDDVSINIFTDKLSLDVSPPSSPLSVSFNISSDDDLPNMPGGWSSEFYVAGGKLTTTTWHDDNDDDMDALLPSLFFMPKAHTFAPGDALFLWPVST